MTFHLWGLLRATSRWSQTLDPLVFVPEESRRTGQQGVRAEGILKRLQCLYPFYRWDDWGLCQVTQWWRQSRDLTPAPLAPGTVAH